MSNESTTKTPAELLADCCRVLLHDRCWQVNDYESENHIAWFGKWTSGVLLILRPDSLDTYAALVAAMTLEQRRRYGVEFINRLDASSPCFEMSVVETMLAPTATHLAAVCAAIGVTK